MKDPGKLLSVITYLFEERGGDTILIGREELNYEVSAEELEDASAGWDSALNAVKETAEKI